MQTYFSILVLTLIGGVTAYLARERGRDPIFWFVIGVLFSIFGLIALLVLPNLAKDSDSKESNPSLKNSPETSSSTFSSFFQSDPPEVPTLLPQDQWFYMDRNWHVTGPLLMSELADRWNLGEIPEESYVWNPTLPEWVPLNAVEGLMAFFHKPERNLPTE